MLTIDEIKNANLDSTSAVLEVARTHVADGAMASSAALALSDAEALYASGDFFYARERAFASLAYSVGRLHPDYRLAQQMTAHAARR